MKARRGPRSARSRRTSRGRRPARRSRHSTRNARRACSPKPASTPAQLNLSLLAYTERAELPDLAAVIQAQLQQIGVKVEIRSEQLGGNRDRPPCRQLRPVPDVQEPPDSTSPIRLPSSPRTTPAREDSIVSNYCDPAVDALVAMKPAAPPIPAARNALYAKVAAQLQDEAVTAFLVHVQHIEAVSEKVRNYRIHPLAHYVLVPELGLVRMTLRHLTAIRTMTAIESETEVRHVRPLRHADALPDVGPDTHPVLRQGAVRANGRVSRRLRGVPHRRGARGLEALPGRHQGCAAPRVRAVVDRVRGLRRATRSWKTSPTGVRTPTCRSRSPGSPGTIPWSSCPTPRTARSTATSRSWGRRSMRCSPPSRRAPTSPGSGRSNTCWSTLGCRRDEILHVSSSLRYDLIPAHDLRIPHKVYVNRGYEPSVPYYRYHEIPDHVGTAGTLLGL